MNHWKAVRLAEVCNGGVFLIRCCDTMLINWHPKRVWKSVEIGQLVGYDCILSASRMNNAIILLMKTAEKAEEQIENSAVIGGSRMTVLPHSATGKKVLLANILLYLVYKVLHRDDTDLYLSLCLHIYGFYYTSYVITTSMRRGKTGYRVRACQAGKVRAHSETSPDDAVREDALPSDTPRYSHLCSIRL